MMDRVIKGRMAPLLAIFFAVLLPQFIINLFSFHNYVAAAFIGGMLAVYLVIFAVYFTKYCQYKNNTKII